MKKNYISIFILFTMCAKAQVGIGKTALSSTSVSLEFGSENRGMVLPWVTSSTAVSNAENGTLVYSLADHKINVKYNSGWKDLTVDNSGNTIDPLTGIDGAIIQNNLSEINNSKVTIGNISSVAGILVLGDSDKAMVLPKVANPHLNIINPSPGMMVFDTAKKLFAVYNGTVWSFWKP